MGRATRGVCSVPNCLVPHRAKSFCHRHYKMWKRHGMTAEEMAVYVPWSKAATFPEKVPSSRVCAMCHKEKPFLEFVTLEAWRNFECRDCNSARLAVGKHSTQEKNRLVSLVRRFRAMGIDFSATDYYNMLVEQEGKCAICGTAEPGRNKDGTERAWSVDHCHSRNIIRGLLCTRCNSALGLFADDPKVMKKAAEYVEYFTGKEE